MKDKLVRKKLYFAAPHRHCKYRRKILNYCYQLSFCSKGFISFTNLRVQFLFPLQALPSFCIQGSITLSFLFASKLIVLCSVASRSLSVPKLSLSFCAKVIPSQTSPPSFSRLPFPPFFLTAATPQGL